MTIRCGRSSLWLAILASAAAVGDGAEAQPAPAPMTVISDIDLSGPFQTRTPWRFTVSQGPDLPDPILGEGETAPGLVVLCLRAAPSAPCDPAVRGATGASNGLYAEAHELEKVEIVRPQGFGGPPLLLVQTGSLRSVDGSQSKDTQVFAYRRREDRFVRVYEQSIGGNHNQETRFIASGPLRGDMISVEPTWDAPYAYWVSVSAFAAGRVYRQVLRYRSATRYGDGNALAVIDSEMPNIERRLGLWRPGAPLPLPAGPCRTPHLSRMELRCDDVR